MQLAGKTHSEIALTAARPTRNRPARPPHPAARRQVRDHHTSGLKRPGCTIDGDLGCALDLPPHATGLDRNGLGTMLVAAGLGAACEHALISLLALNGLRVPGGHRRQHRSAGHRAGAPDLGGHPRGWQGGHGPARAAHRPGDRPGHRRAQRRTGLPDRRWPTAGPARRRADRPPGRPPCRDRHAGRAAHLAACAHHRRAGMLGSRYEMCRKPPPTLIPGPPCDPTAPAPVSTGTPGATSRLMPPVPPGNTP